jgi:hypothetical protein
MGKNKDRADRPSLDDDVGSVRLPEGTLARLEAVLRPGETPSEFIRKSVLEEIELRERARRRRKARASVLATAGKTG